jgi:hypothetical protein
MPARVAWLLIGHEIQPYDSTLFSFGKLEFPAAVGLSKLILGLDSRDNATFRATSELTDCNPS